MTMTDVQPYVSQSAAFTGASVSVAAIAGDWTIKIQVGSLTQGKKARIVVEDSVDAFGTSLSGPAFSFLGGFGVENDHVRSIKKADFPSLRLGTASAVLRAKLAELDPAASITYKVWIEF